MTEPLLQVNQLTTSIGTGVNQVNVVDDVSFTINRTFHHAFTTSCGRHQKRLGNIKRTKFIPITGK